MIIKGADGSNGKSAYELALDNGFVGNENAFMDSLMPVAGEDFYTDAEITALKNQIVLQALSEIDTALGSITGTTSLEESIVNIETNIATLKSQMTKLETDMSNTSVSVNELSDTVDLVLADVTNVKENLANAINTDPDTSVNSTDGFDVFASGITNIIADKLAYKNQLESTQTFMADGKTLVANTITNEGVTTNTNSTFQIMCDNIQALSSQKYNNGYADGLASATNASITYEKHFHTGSSITGGGCYSNPIYHQHQSSCYRYSTKCNACGRDLNGKRYGSCQYCWTQLGVSDTATLICGKNNSTITNYSTLCGYIDGQILSATINY